MSGVLPVGAAFRERYAIERFRDGGVLIDLATGTYSRLNVTATEICSVLGRTESLAETVSRTARLLDTNDVAAELAVRKVTEGLRLLGPRREPAGAFRYRPSAEGGYVLISAGVSTLSISEDGAAVRLASEEVRPSISQLFDYLRAIAPKALFLQSTIVLHGAASCAPGGIRVISGESGAGKTTTARAFDAAGAKLFAEDMLVLAAEPPLRVYPNGEEAINAWARSAAEVLSRDPNHRVDGKELQASRRGEAKLVSEVWFLDRTRRYLGDEDIRPRRLGETDAALAMMTGLFLGGASSEDWRSFLAVARKVATSTPVFETFMPAGVDRLLAGVRRYTENSAS